MLFRILRRMRAAYRSGWVFTQQPMHDAPKPPCALARPAPACTPTVVGLTLLALTNGRRDGRHGRPATTHPAVAVMPVHAKYPTPLHPVCEGGSKAQETTSGAHANPGAGGCCCNTQAKRNGTGLLPSIWKQLLYGESATVVWTFCG